MKVRNGFVSNSSSSSFIVAFEKRPNNSDEVEKLLYDISVRSHINTSVIAEKVYNDLSINSATLDEIADAISGGYFEGQPRADAPK